MFLIDREHFKQLPGILLVCERDTNIKTFCFIHFKILNKKSLKILKNFKSSQISLKRNCHAIDLWTVHSNLLLFYGLFGQRNIR